MRILNLGMDTQTPTGKLMLPASLRLAAEGATKISIARQLGISEATVYRILAVSKE